MFAIEVLDPIDKSNMLYLPLSISGVTSYFHCHKSTTSEFDDEESHHRIELTAEEPLWDPGSDNYSYSEDRMVDFMGRIVCCDPAARGQQIVINTMSSSFQVYDADITANDNFGTALRVIVNLPNFLSRVGVTSSRKEKGIDYISLSRK